MSAEDALRRALHAEAEQVPADGRLDRIRAAIIRAEARALLRARRAVARVDAAACPRACGPDGHDRMYHECAASHAALAEFDADLTSRAAARGATRAAAKAHDCKESTGMHTLQSESTPRGRQMAAAYALFHLLDAGPDVLARWSLDEMGALHGHVHSPASDRLARDGLDEFAAFLGAPVTQDRDHHSDLGQWTVLSTSATYRGVPVSVWTHVDVRPVGSAA